MLEIPSILIEGHLGMGILYKFLIEAVNLLNKTFKIRRSFFFIQRVLGFCQVVKKLICITFLDDYGRACTRKTYLHAWYEFVACKS